MCFFLFFFLIFHTRDMLINYIFRVVGSEMGDTHFRVRCRQSEQGPVPKPRGEIEKKDFFTPFWGKTILFCKYFVFTRPSWTSGPHLHPKISTPRNSFCLFGTRDKAAEASLPLRGVNEAFNHLLFLLLCLLFISVCRNHRNTGAWQKAAIERLWLLFAPMMGN